jgi:transposase InsO family protein
MSFRSGLFAEACLELGITQKFTRAYRPQTNGKAERFIQSALREWAYGRVYENSDQRGTPCRPGRTSTTGIARTTAST